MCHPPVFELCSADYFIFLLFLPFFFSLQFPSQCPTVQVMTAVTDCEPSYPHSCPAPHPSTSSCLNHIFLSPGQCLPLAQSVSPISPLHTDNSLISPIPVSLIASPSPAVAKVGPSSPQHQSTAALQQSLKCEASHSQPAFISSLPTHTIDTHTGPSQNTHPPTNGSTQPLIQVTIIVAVECKSLRGVCVCVCNLRVVLL